MSIERANELLRKCVDSPTGLVKEESIELDKLWIELKFDTNPDVQEALDYFYSKSADFWEES